MIGDNSVLLYMLKLPFYNMLFTMLLIWIFDRIGEKYYKTVVYAVLAQIPITIISTFILSRNIINPILLFKSTDTLMQFLLSGMSIVFYGVLQIKKDSK